MADSHAFRDTICRHTCSTQRLTRTYGAIANMASHLEVFGESFTAKQKYGFEHDFFSYFNVFFKQKVFPCNVLEGQNTSENGRYSSSTWRNESPKPEFLVVKDEMLVT